MDLFASMTEAQALKTYQKLSGMTAGSVFDHAHESIG